MTRFIADSCSDMLQMEGVDFAEFKETQYDILASELRKHLDMMKI